MIQRRLLSFVFVLLFAFAQQQALVHPYVHMVHGQESTSQENSPNDKQGQIHSETCGKCISLAGISAAVSSQAQITQALPAVFKPVIEVNQSFFSKSYLPYHSRAPPTLA